MSSQPINLLLIEDDPGDVDLFREMLSDSKQHLFDVKWADRLRVGLEYLGSRRVDVILLDLTLPDSQGLETFTQVYAQAASVPIVVLSGIADEMIAMKAVQQGAQDYLVKGEVDGNLLVRAIRYAIERKATAEQLRHAAMHDALTGLPNRALLMDRLESSIQRAKDSKDYLFALLFLDLDRFKVINDSLGHAVGDELLIAIASRLQACVRSTDTVARFGGDEFAILLNNIQGFDDVTRIADRVQEALNLPVDLKGQTVFTTASIGIALSGIEYNRSSDFLRNADTAMYRAKVLGRARCEVFDTSMYDEVMARWQLETELRRAIERQEFRVYYQPFVSLRSGQIAGVEALLRWQHPERGLVAPTQFIPLAEEAGLIEPIGEWVLRTACAQTSAWQKDGYAHLQVAVNISARQLLPQSSTGQDRSLTELVKEVLRETGLSPQMLELEITEGVVIHDSSLKIVNELSAMGARISLDDFGLSSSLDFLKQLPLNTVKIDQSFVNGMVSDSGDAAIVTAIIAMAHSLKLEVIAEGVETGEQLAFLRSKECDKMQGSLFSQPLSAEAMTKLLQEGRCLPS